MSKPVHFVRLDVAKFLLRVLKTAPENRGVWVSELAEALAENKRGLHHFADELFEEVEEFREFDRNRKVNFSKESKESKDSKDSAFSTTIQTDSHTVKQTIKHKTHPPTPQGGLSEAEKYFEEARKFYPGTKRGFDIEWQNFIKKHPRKAIEAAPRLLPGIRLEMRFKSECERVGAFVASWKNFQTWINQSCWEQEFPNEVIVNGR